MRSLEGAEGCQASQLLEGSDSSKSWRCDCKHSRRWDGGLLNEAQHAHFALR